MISVLGVKSATISIRVKHADGTVTDYGVVSTIEEEDVD